MSVDHSPAWALIPWYGDDGLGAPTLDDWRVWADWLMAHDPDVEGDRTITFPSQAIGRPRNPRRRGDTGAHGRARR